MDEVLKIRKVPPKPEEPRDSECCGSGCSPCVFDIYALQLKKWEIQCQSLEDDVGEPLDDNIQHHISQEMYLNFKILKIIQDSPSSKILRLNISPITSDYPERPKYGNYRWFQPGQHVIIKIADHAKPYTVLNQGITETGEAFFDLLIRVYAKGQLTPLLDALGEGESISLRGPFGTLYSLRRNEYESIVILAAGTGIAPMHMVIDKILLDEDDDTRIKLVFCNRTINSILIKWKLKEWSSFWNFQAVHYISRSGPDVEEVPYKMTVHFKRFTRADFLTECPKIDRVQFLVCGGRSFTKDMVNFLNKAGVPEDQHHVF